MRIGIDGRKFRDFGIGTYVRNLLRQLARHDDDDHYVVLCHDADFESVAAFGPKVRPVREEAGNYSMREQIAIPIDVRREGIDLFHAIEPAALILGRVIREAEIALARPLLISD